MQQVPLQSPAIISIAVVLGLSCLALSYQRNAWRRIALISIVSVILYVELNGIYYAGVHAARSGVQEGTADKSYLNGVRKTMEPISPTQIVISFGLLMLTTLALFPTTLRKNAPTSKA